ncbi:hypothetical protein LTR10_022780 [Elasticomyces elasticus]|uniref:Uncharacterized protein n=1 Tax=Exophiala sideris TaxID=1016849 RepID=A0ABR0JNV2_9EURO|nr:hypothetical protein LTR10_022780 [Elasticomyces elasticus]KAK5036593.1 hypothetical protein LTS07_002320 [Exophiala sideris]KAK5041576.1 hypothetical protein LTR13_002243 [Exophiala sideris]KAK5066976.1 hypothetical protein LTR69_002324 [Exophiala sideris]
MSRRSAHGQGSGTTPRPQHYQLVSPGTPADPRNMTQVSPGFIFNNKDQLIQSLRTHRVNTITELRRIEKIFAFLDSAEVTEPMTSAWAHYVNSNNLLNELRGLTKTYPFSSECLDEAKAMVVRDPSSVRSWNYCWLVLIKMERENLITKHARALASKASTWGGRRPTAADFDKLVKACVAEWTRALRQMLRHWDNPPSTTGH